MIETLPRPEQDGDYNIDRELNQDPDNSAISMEHTVQEIASSNLVGTLTVIDILAVQPVFSEGEEKEAAPKKSTRTRRTTDSMGDFGMPDIYED